VANIIVDRRAAGVNTPNTQRIMLSVMLALVPGIIAYIYFISPLVLINAVFAVVAAIMLEAFACRLRGRNVMLQIQDASIALAALLLALAVPPMIPLWQLLVGVAIMVILGKHVYGGLGHNPFNPAMVGYAALLISFPQSMTFWLNPFVLESHNLPDLFQAKLTLDIVTSNPQIAWDAITQATPLEHIRSLKAQSQPIALSDLLRQTIESGWCWVNLGFLTGGLFLLYKRVIQWHIPVSVIAGFILWSSLFSQQALPLHLSLFSGSLMLGAFFIATDPVSAASSKRGRLIFGFGIGSLCFVIREYGGYPEGFAFAVLLMNLCVPLIDHADRQLAR